MANKDKVKKMAFGGMGSTPPDALRPMPAGTRPMGVPKFAQNYVKSQRPMGMMGGNGPTPLNALRPMPAGARSPMAGFGQAAMRAPSLITGKPRGVFKDGGKVNSKSASSRADGCAQRGKTKGKVI